MSDEPVIEFETDTEIEELLDKAGQTARVRGYDIDKETENALFFSDSRTKYRLEVEKGQVELYGQHPEALGIYKTILQSKL